MEVKDSSGELRETHVARPSNDRKKEKNLILDQLSLPENDKLLRECVSIYEKLLSSE